MGELFYTLLEAEGCKTELWYRQIYNRIRPHRLRTGHAQDSRAVRLLTVIDEYTRECLAIRADRQIRSSDVIEMPS